MKVGLIATLSLALCAGCTTYKPEGFAGGFRDLRLAENVFQISARGNAFADPKEIQEMALLRSSEVVLNNGYRYFEIGHSSNQIQVSRSYIPPQAYTSGTIQNYGSYSQLNATTQFMGGGVIDWEKPESVLVIVAYKDRPSDGKAYVDAQMVLQSLGPKYIKK